jgi:hypothetical protein
MDYERNCGLQVKSSGNQVGFAKKKVWITGYKRYGSREI